MINDQPLLGTSVSSKRPSRLFGHYLVKEHFQFKFALLVAGFLAFATITIWYFGRTTVATLVTNGTVQNELAIEQLRNINSLIFKISIIFMTLAVFLSLIFSHLVAGPI